MSCYPTADTVISQHQWGCFVCASHTFLIPLTIFLILGAVLPSHPLGNSKLPEFTQFNLVNIYLFHADSRQLVLSIKNETNPVGRAGQTCQQVDDRWFTNGGVDWRGSNISYPFFWVITRSDKTLDGTEVPQATFSAVRKCYFYLLLLC